MNRKTVFIFLYATFSFFNLFSQEEIYMDENLKVIDSVTFTKKCRAYVFNCKVYETDSIKVNKVLNKFSFGKLYPNQFLELKQFLEKQSNSNIETNNVIAIVYRDSLLGYHESLERQKRNFDIEKQRLINSLPFKITKEQLGHRLHVPTKKEYEKRIRKYAKEQQKCQTWVEKKLNTKLFYTYSYDVNYPKYNPSIWLKDSGTLKNTFFKVFKQYSTIILKPNGEYFSSIAPLSIADLQNLMIEKKWSSHKHDLQNSIENYDNKPVGIFTKPFGFNEIFCSK